MQFLLQKSTLCANFRSLLAEVTKERDDLKSMVDKLSRASTAGPQAALPSRSLSKNRRGPRGPERSIRAKQELIRNYDALLPRMSKGRAAKELHTSDRTLRRILSKRNEIMNAPNSSVNRCRVFKKRGSSRGEARKESATTTPPPRKKIKFARPCCRSQTESDYAREVF